MNQELSLEQAFNNLVQAANLAKYTLAEAEAIKQSISLVQSSLSKLVLLEQEKGAAKEAVKEPVIIED